MAVSVLVVQLSDCNSMDLGKPLGGSRLMHLSIFMQAEMLFKVYWKSSVNQQSYLRSIKCFSFEQLKRKFLFKCDNVKVDKFFLHHFNCWNVASPLALVDTESACNAGDLGDTGSIPALGISPRGGNDNPLQYSCLENPWTGGWRATVHGATKSQDTTEQLSMHTANKIFGKTSLYRISFISSCFEKQHALFFFVVDFTRLY